MRRVQGFPSLRKTSDGTIVNVDSTAKEAAIAHKNRIAQREEDINTLKGRVDDLQEMLEKLIDASS